MLTFIISEENFSLSLYYQFKEFFYVTVPQNEGKTEFDCLD